MATPPWCTIESDPGVFTELIAQIGVKGVQVEELVDLENETFNRLKPILGLVFLFKWQDEKKADAAAERGRIVLEGDTHGVYFAQQVIHNACATQAILNILLNRPELDLGSEIAGFKSFTQDLPADMRGLAMSNSEAIRTQHNSFARPEPFVFEEKKSKGDDDDDVFHFIGYVPIGGNLYELDGLQRGPILLGECTSENWLEKVRPVIQARIAKYTSKEIRFALMAIVRNRTDVANERLAAIAKRRERLMGVLTGTPAPAPAAAAVASGMDTSEDDLPSDPEAVTVALGNLEEEEKILEATIESEKSKFAAWKLENVRRKHNYVPFIFNLLKSLAEKGKLNGLVESSAKATVERVAKARAEKEKRAAAKREAAATATPKK